MARLILLNGAPGVGKSTIAAALAMAHSQLEAGLDVIVPQYLGRPAFVTQLEALCDATDAQFVEIVLTTSHAVGKARFTERGDVPQLVGADESFDEMHTRLARLGASRPHAVHVDAHGDVVSTVALVAAVLDPGT